jgi:hypothetical protein
MSTKSTEKKRIRKEAKLLYALSFLLPFFLRALLSVSPW